MTQIKRRPSKDTKNMFRVLYKRNEARVMNYLSSDRWKCRTKLVHLPKVFLSFYKDFHELDIIPTVFYVRKIYCSQCLGWYYIAKNGKRPFFVRKWNEMEKERRVYDFFPAFLLSDKQVFYVLLTYGLFRLESQHYNTIYLYPGGYSLLCYNLFPFFTK